MGKTLVTAPTKQVVTLSDVQAHLRIDDDSAEDVLLMSYIAATTKYIENYLSRALITQTWDYFLDEFSNEIELPAPPLQSVTSVSYIDTDGNTQVLSGSVYDVDTSVEPGVVRLAYGQSWPAIRSTPNAVIIRFIAGYGDTETSIEAPIKQAALLLIGHFYENRESTAILTIKEVPMAFKSLLGPYERYFF